MKIPYPYSWKKRTFAHKLCENGLHLGKYAQRQQYSVLRRVFESKRRRLKLMHFDFWEIFFMEVNYWKTIVRTLPTRIKYRTLSLRDITR